MKLHKGRALLAAGGTGGHLFPAQALSVELKSRGWDVDLATDERCDQYNFQAGQIYILPSDTLRSKNPLRAARTFLMLGRGYLKARSIIRKTKPDIAIGFGGYPSLAPMIAASRMKIPAILHEANAVLGRANRLLAPRMSAIALATENTALLEDEYKNKARVVGVPVRADVLKVADKVYKAPGPKSQIRVLVFGGSQGARIFADVLPETLARLPQKLLARIDLTQQARPEDKERLRETYAKLGLKNYEVESFFQDMPKRIAQAHLVIARSGASTVNELTVIGRPSILVPLPNAIDNDQLRNAQSLASAGGAILAEQKELNAERLSALLLNTLQDPVFMGNCARAAKAAGRPNAVKLLADLVEETAFPSARLLQDAS